MILGIPTRPSVKSPTTATMFVAQMKMQEMARTELEKSFAQAFTVIVTLPHQNPEQWDRLFEDLEPLFSSARQKWQVFSSDPVKMVKEMKKCGINSMMIDMLQVTLDLISCEAGFPGSSYWPQYKAVKLLHMSCCTPGHLKEVISYLS
jgi:hypothetical protein